MRSLTFVFLFASFAYTQVPPIEPGVSQELARWRAAHYSDVRYKLNLTLEKMSPVLKGTMEISVKVSGGEGEKLSGVTQAETRAVASVPPIILDWRKIKGHEEKSTITNATVNGKPVAITTSPPADAGGSDTEHLIFRDGVVLGENVIKLDFTSPILTSGSAITRYVDKEDASEYIYSLFVPSDASTAFPVFDQPDLKARFELTTYVPMKDGGLLWKVTSNSPIETRSGGRYGLHDDRHGGDNPWVITKFRETKPISTYVFAFASGPWEKVADTGGNPSSSEGAPQGSGAPQRTLPTGRVSAFDPDRSIYVRRSQAAKFKTHAAEVFRLNREAVKYFEQYFDYKFPFPKYDLVLIPEFPFGGMEHAGATFLRESAIIFPQEPTKNDHISRATLIFHETAHQWFGDTVTMRWFDDLWLKEGFATFMAYKALEKIMPEMNSWKVFYERVKQGAYQTDSTKGTTPIYQEIKNLSAAKSAYGAIVYNKAPAFLRQAEFYLGEDKFQSSVRAFLKKHEFGNAGWEDLVKEFETASGKELDNWAKQWVTFPGAPIVRINYLSADCFHYSFRQSTSGGEAGKWEMVLKPLVRFVDGTIWDKRFNLGGGEDDIDRCDPEPILLIPNYQDYGYGIFLLDDKSRDYVLKNIQNEKDPFLRSIMWGALWDSVREGELDPREYVELVVKNLTTTPPAKAGTPPKQGGELDESTTALLLNRVGTAMNYYIGPTGGNASVNERGDRAPAATLPNRRFSARDDLSARLENMLIERMQNAPTLGQRITYYRAFLNVATSDNARVVLKAMLKGGNPSRSEGAPQRPGAPKGTLPTGRVSALAATENARNTIPLKTKDKFDIVTRLLIFGDPDAPKLLADLEKTETSDDAKRYAYAAKAGIPTADNKAKFWNDFTNNKEISESWIEAAFGPWNSIRHSEVTLQYLQKALKELPNHKRNRKIFFVNGWLGAFIGGQRSEEALAIVNKFLADNPNLDKDLRLKILENVDLIERAVKIRSKYGKAN